LEGGAQTWHYGLIAKWWAEFNDDFRPHEIPYFQRHIEQGGEPTLDVGCGTGRLLIPYLRARLDVDGCDVSADMIALCRERRRARDCRRRSSCRRCTNSTRAAGTRRSSSAARSGSGARGSKTFSRSVASTTVSSRRDLATRHRGPLRGRQALAALDEGRAREASGSRRAAAFVTARLRRKRVGTSHANRRARPARPASDLEIHAQQWRNGELVADEDRILNIGMYLKGELLLCWSKPASLQRRRSGRSQRRRSNQRRRLHRLHRKEALSATVWSRRRFSQPS
jgi:hypothetical protein